MEEIKITLNENIVRISRRFVNDTLVRILLDDANMLAKINNVSVEKQLAECAYARQIHIKQNFFEPDEYGYVYNKDYFYYPNEVDGEIDCVFFDDDVYHSSLAKVAEILKVDVAEFFRKLEESYKSIWT